MCRRAEHAIHGVDTVAISVNCKSSNKPFLFLLIRDVARSRKFVVVLMDFQNVLDLQVLAETSMKM